MIKNISLRNFKAFARLEDLPLLPLTVFCGANSSGKTSVIQSVLLWKQTLESRMPGQTVLLNGRFVHLGSFSNVVFCHNPEAEIQLGITLADSGNPAALQYHYWADLGLGDLSDTITTANSVSLLRAGFEIRSDKQVKDSIRIEPEEGSWKICWEKPGVSAPASQCEFFANITFGGFVPILIEPRLPLDLTTVADIQEVFAPFRQLLDATFENTSYLGPLREEPARRYIYEEEARDIGIKGENAAYIYLIDRYKPIASPAYFIENDRFIEKPESSLSAALARWLSLMEVHDFSPEQTDEIVRLTLRSSSSDATRVNIADVGFGVSQVFPILLEGLRLPIGGTLILEQPEIHLHPKLELQLADFLLSLAMAGKRVIVETHSDHIVNRLVRRIVEDNDSTLKELVGVYFVTPSPKGTEVENVQVDETRGIVNWPAGFFDQGPSEQEKIIQAGLDKRRRQRSQK